MTPHEFVAKWRTVTLTERSAAQQHFLDLCRLLDQPTPVEAAKELNQLRENWLDPEGATEAELKKRTLTNHNNYVGFSGVQTSPFFGQATNVLNPRKVELGMRFGF